jgi:outer membrane protein OmpA-like peptidoglycan-associated protein
VFASEFIIPLPGRSPDPPPDGRPGPIGRAGRLAIPLTVVAVALAGCGADGAAGQPTGGLGIVVQATAQVPVVASSSALSDALDIALDNQSDDVVVVADGRPQVLAAGSLHLRTENGVAQRAEQGGLRDEILSVIAAAAANDPEVDLLSAVDLAARQIGDVDGPRTLVVVSSGLSTVSPMAFQQGLLGADPQEVVDFLAASQELPDLTSFTVVMSGFGDTAPPQIGLTRSQRLQLVAIWKAVFQAAGAGVRVDARPLTGAPRSGLPQVATVSVDLPPNPPCTSVLPASVVAFRPDSSDFVDEAAAREVLLPLAQRLRGGSGPVNVTGTTARVGSLEGQRALASKRAQRVSALLVELGGLDPARMHVQGLGSEFPEYVPDHDAVGTLLPQAAAVNRAVRVVTAPTDCGLN